MDTKYIISSLKALRLPKLTSAKVYLALLLLFAFICSPAKAQVTGSAIDGGTIIIYGSGFGSHSLDAGIIGKKVRFYTVH